MTKQLNKLLCEAINENKNEKITLVEDVFKVMRLLFGFGMNEHLKAITEPEQVFDTLYDMSIDDLELYLASLSATASMKARELAGFATDEHTTKP